ncbi:MAG: hypothetical protein JST89_14470 [Cyanobacteria bacterium SZAS-4]|nr:hypothetical protein [Cyanobacteria bacterium SZAS-4]
MNDSPAHEPNQILAMLRQGVSEDDAKKAIVDAGGSVLNISSNGRLTAILIDSKTVKNTIEQLKNSNCFQAVQLNYLSNHG